VIVRKTSSVVDIHWWGQEDVTHYKQGDARYEVDRGRWKILGVLRGNPLDPDQNTLADALTELRQSYRVEASAYADTPTPPTEEINEMQEKSNAAHEREAAQRALANGDYRERDTYTAKQVAGRCGTDAKTMRKFFRSAHSTVEPVGQGGRYEFAAKDLPKIQREFTAWMKRSAGRTPIMTPAKKAVQEQIQEVKAKKIDPTIEEPEPDPGAYLRPDEEPDEWGSSVDREPTPEELEEADDLELDLDDLDAEDD
jgi:hypothetical protein